MVVAVGGDVEEVVLAGGGLDQEEVAEVGEGFGGDVAEILAVLDQAVDDLEGAAGVADGDGVGELVLDLGAGGAEEGGDDGVVDLAAAEDAGLVQERQRVAGAALGVARDGGGGRLRERDALGGGDGLEVLRELLHGDAAEVEALAPADDRRRHLVRLGGGEHEPDAGRRLLEDLQQGVEGLAREALRLVDDVDLLAAHRRRGGRAFAELAGVLDAAV